jgi:hypothetical protein
MRPRTLPLPPPAWACRRRTHRQQAPCYRRPRTRSTLPWGDARSTAIGRTMMTTSRMVNGPQHTWRQFFARRGRPLRPPPSSRPDRLLGGAGAVRMQGSGRHSGVGGVAVRALGWCTACLPALSRAGHPSGNVSDHDGGSLSPTMTDGGRFCHVRRRDLLRRRLSLTTAPVTAGDLRRSPRSFAADVSTASPSYIVSRLAGCLGNVCAVEASATSQGTVASPRRCRMAEADFATHAPTVEHPPNQRPPVVCHPRGGGP